MPDPNTGPRFELPTGPGITLEDLQLAIFDVQREAGTLDQRSPDQRRAAEGPLQRQTMNDFLRAIPSEQGPGMEFQFQSWAAANGEVADFNDADQFSRFQAEFSGFGPDTGGGGGAVGRTEFESERLLNEANAQLAQQRAATEAFVRENQRQQAATQAQDRVGQKLELLQMTDQLADLRREAAVNALIQAAPFMVNPGQQFTPGFEPGGVGQRLGGLLGANVPNQQLPTAQLPLNELANPQLAAPPSLIAQQLDPGLQAQGTPQIPF